MKKTKERSRKITESLVLDTPLGGATLVERVYFSYGCFDQFLRKISH